MNWLTNMKNINPSDFWNTNIYIERMTLGQYKTRIGLIICKYISKNKLNDSKIVTIFIEVIKLNLMIINKKLS